MKLRLLLRAQWDRVAAIGLLIAGGVMLVIGYLRVSGSVFVDEQMSYVASAGLGGVSLIGVGIGVLISADLHDEWHKLDRIERAISRGSQSTVDVDLDHATHDGVLPEQTTGTAQAASPSRADSARATPPVPAAPSGALAVAGPADELRRMAVVAGGGVFAAWAVMFGGWAKAAGSDDWDTGFEALGVGTLGLALVVVAAASYPLRLRRHLAGRRAALLRPWARAAASAEQSPEERSSERVEVERSKVFVASGQTHFHRGGCVMLPGRHVKSVPRAELDDTLTACGLCSPA